MANRRNRPRRPHMNRVSDVAAYYIANHTEYAAIPETDREILSFLDEDHYDGLKDALLDGDIRFSDIEKFVDNPLELTCWLASIYAAGLAES